MFPVLFEVFGHKINGYGAFVSLAHLFGIAAVLFLTRRQGKPLEPHVDLIFAVMLAGIVGARAGYVLENSQEFTSPWQWLYLWKGGLSLFSGLLLGFPAYLAMLFWRKLPLWETSDRLVLVLPLSLALVRLGCFSAGCCYGIPTDLPWGVRPISSLIPFHLAGESLHPTQLYEAGYLVLLAGALFYLQSKRPPEGTVVTGFLFGYGIFRSATNSLRGDLEMIPALGISLSQGAALLLTALAGVTLAWRLFPRKSRPTSGPLP